MGELKISDRVGRPLKENPYVYNDAGLFRALSLKDGLFVYCAPSSTFPVEVDWSTLSMASGLRDKNDDDIYSGDVVEYSTGGVPSSMLFEVVFKYGAFGYIYCGEFHTFAENSHLSFGRIGRDDRFVVVGNVFQNPELREMVAR